MVGALVVVAAGIAGWLALDELTGRVDDLEAEKAELASEVEAANGQLEDVASAAAAVTGRVSTLQRRVEDVEYSVTGGGFFADGIEAQVADLELQVDSIDSCLQSLTRALRFDTYFFC